MEYGKIAVHYEAAICAACKKKVYKYAWFGNEAICSFSCFSKHNKDIIKTPPQEPEKRPVGRPPKPKPEEELEKRPVGRPPKPEIPQEHIICWQPNGQEEADLHFNEYLTYALWYEDDQNAFYIYKCSRGKGTNPDYVTASFKIPTYSLPFTLKECAFEDFADNLEARALKKLEIEDKKGARFLKICGEKYAFNQKDLYTFLDGGFDVDETLFIMTLTDYIPFPSYKTRWGFAKYAPHSIILTNTKTGKTHITERMGRNMQNPTCAGLLGFSTSNTTSVGSLNGQTQTITIDEVQEEKQEELYGHLFKVMESGETEIVRGQAPVVCRSLAPLRFCGNPVPPEFENKNYYLVAEQLAKDFTAFLMKITKNAPAFSSRQACVYFNPKAKESILREIIPDEELDRLRVMAVLFKNEMSKRTLPIFLACQQWLETPYDKKYVETLKKIDMKNPMLALFMEGQPHNFRHARGMALRLAIFENFEIVLADKWTKEELLKDAELNLTRIKEINLRSFENFAQVPDTVFASLFEEKLKQEKKAVKYFIYLAWKNAAETSTQQFLLLALKHKYSQQTYSVGFEEFLKVVNNNKKTLEEYGFIIRGEDVLIPDLKRASEAFKIARQEFEPQETRVEKAAEPIPP